ncbi:MAG: hypothetical protein RLZ22_202 [Verrucomicrobiota bacterium]|jgi:hypothetical protein
MNVEKIKTSPIDPVFESAWVRMSIKSERQITIQ